MTTRTRILHALLAAVLTDWFVVLPISAIASTTVPPIGLLLATVVLGLCQFQWPQPFVRVVAPIAVGLLAARVMVELSYSVGFWPGPLFMLVVMVAGAVATARMQPRVSVTFRPSREGGVTAQ